MNWRDVLFLMFAGFILSAFVVSLIALHRVSANSARNCDEAIAASVDDDVIDYCSENEYMKFIVDKYLEDKRK